MKVSPLGTRIDKLWAFLIGTGVALSPIHNLWLTNATRSNGEVTFFLPAFGYALLIVGTGMFLLYNWNRVRETGWGDRHTLISLLVIVGAVIVSSTGSADWHSRIASIGMIASLFGLYLASRTLGKLITCPLAIGTVIASLGVIVSAITRPEVVTGGLVFESNYDIVIGYILMGTALYDGKYRLPLIALSITSVVLTGSPEGIFALFILLVMVLYRKDWGRALFYVLSPVVVVVTVWYSMGWFTDLYSYAFDILEGEKTVTYVPAPPGVREEQGIEYVRRDSGDPPTGNPAAPPAPVTPSIPSVPTTPSPVPPAPSPTPPATSIPPIPGDGLAVNPFEDRWNVIRTEMGSLTALGDGYNLTEFKTNTVHNVPLIIVQQLGYPGILAGLAWLVVGIRGLKKASKKYAWGLMLALGVFDHFTWTQMAPYWWILVGVSTTSPLVSDRISEKGSERQDR